ncbi:MAG: hypothetical protein OEY92_05410, partial [Elusimicrobiota bacterium]|nr:hypothetical protein [Elusimicrobiota bacterium]
FAVSLTLYFFISVAFYTYLQSLSTKFVAAKRSFANKKAEFSLCCYIQNKKPPYVGAQFVEPE